MSLPNLKRQSDHLEKKPIKRKSQDFSGHSKESAESRERLLEESSNTQNAAQTSTLAKKCFVVVKKLSIEDVERMNRGIKPTQTNVKSVPQTTGVQYFDTHSNEHFESDGTKPQDLGSYKDPRTSSQEPLSNETTSNSYNQIEIDLDLEEALLDYSFSSSSEDSDEECTGVNVKNKISPDYNILVESKKVQDSPTVEGINGPKELFSSETKLNVNSSKPLNESHDLTLEIKAPMYDKDSSVLCFKTKVADVSDKFPKSSYPPVENVSKSNKFSGTNEDTAPKTTPKGPKPKLTKTSILKKQIVKRNPIKNNPSIKPNYDNKLDRIVDISGAKQGKPCFKITKIFNNAWVNNDQGIQENCSLKQNPGHVSNLKPTDTSPKFHKDTKAKDNEGKNIKSDFSIKPIGLLNRKNEVALQDNGEDQNNSVRKKHNSQDSNVKEKPTLEQISRKISFRNNDEFKRSTKHNTQCGSRNDSLNQAVTLTSMDFSFATPKEWPKQTMQTTSNEDDDDDNESVMSFFASDNLVSFIDNDGEEPKKHKRGWEKFRIENLDNSNDEQDNQLTDEEEYNLQISSRQFIQNDSNLERAIHSNENRINEERRDAHSPNQSRIVNFKSWDERSSQKANNYPLRDLKTKPSPESFIKNYCVLYLRMSVESHRDCNLIHNVPSDLFSVQGIQNEKQIESVIQYIMESNFRNPPQDLVSAIVLYCVKCNQSDLQRRTSTLISLGSSLKGVKTDKAEQLWCTYFKTISQYLVLPSSKKSMHISRVLEGIFGKHLDFRSEDCEVFKQIQVALIEVHRMFKPYIQLLTCVGFMCEKISNSRLDLKLICPEFALSIVKQCLNEINIQPPPAWKKFAYKVVFNLISDYHLSYVIDLCNRDRHTISRFIEVVESRKVSDSARFRKIKHLISTNEIKKSSLEERRGLDCQPPINHQLTSTFTAQVDMDMPIKFQTIATSLENHYDKGELDVEEVYSHFKHPDKRKIFISCLSLLKVAVKRHLSNVIMSFISDEASNENWDICYELFKCLPDWDFKTIKNLKGNRTPTSNLLIVILVLLKNKKTTEALNLFFQYELFNHEGDWILSYIPEDTTKHSYICSIFKEQIKTLENNRFFTTMRLVSKQATLDAPIDLAENVITLLQELIKQNHQKEIVQLLSRILDENKDEPLIFPSENMYRALIVILCKENKLKHGFLMLLKAINHVKLYPSIPRRRDSISLGNEMCIELHSSLRSEEFKVIVFTIFKGFGDIIQNCGFTVKFKEYLDGPRGLCFGYEHFDSYILVEDTSVRNSIQRFRTAVMELIPNARFKTRGHDGIQIEKIGLKEFCDKQNKS